MRCLIVSDLHYALPQFDWLLQAAPRYDLVVLAGDALDVGSLVDFRAQTLVVRKYLQRISSLTRLLVCSGNHDLDAQNETGEKIARWIEDVRGLGIACDGDSVLIGDTLFTICPWWDGPKVRDQLLVQLEADSKKRDGKRWVWIHHAPPRGSAISWSGSRTMGDADVDQWIRAYKPDLVFAGHIHQSPFVKDGSWVDRVASTWVFNTGHQFGAPPAHIVMNTKEDEAIWISAMGVQSVKLQQPLERPVQDLHEMPIWFDAPAA